MNDVLKELCGTFGPAGRESLVAERLKAEVKKTGMDVETDALGNVVARKGSGPYRVFCTHIDQPCWVAEHRDAKGILHLKSVPADSRLGEGWAVDGEGRRCRVFGGGKDMRAEPLEDGVEVGTFLVPPGEFVSTQRSVFGSALSARLGAALLVELGALIQAGEGSVALVFYVGRHLDFMGLGAALESLDAERLYVIEPLPSAEGEGGCSSGDGAVALLQTKHSIAPSVWVDEVSGLGKVKLVLGHVPSAADALAKAGMPSLVLGVGIRYFGSRIEGMMRSDYDGLSRLLAGLVKGAPRR